MLSERERRWPLSLWCRGERGGGRGMTKMVWIVVFSPANGWQTCINGGQIGRWLALCRVNSWMVSWMWMGMECSRLYWRLSTTGRYLFCICVERIGMGCRFAGRTICLPYGNGGLQDELSACLTVTGKEVLETLGPLVSCVLYLCWVDWNGLSFCRMSSPPASW